MTDTRGVVESARKLADILHANSLVWVQGKTECRWLTEDERKVLLDVVGAASLIERLPEKEEAGEVERLRRDCAELYQVIGTMAEHCPDPEDPAIIKALDNASDAADGDPRRHDDLLPFILVRPSPSATAMPGREEIARVIFDRACGPQQWDNTFYLLERDGCYETADAILALLSRAPAISTHNKGDR